MTSFDYTNLITSSDPIERCVTGAVIFEMGQPGDAMYVVKSGMVDVRIGTRVFDRVGKGGIIGEMALLDKAVRSASAIAATDCEVVAIDRRRLDEILRQSPSVALELTKSMVRRLRSMNYQAQFDLVTRLPNRTFFAEQCQSALQRALRQNTLVGVLHLDLDHFAKINDSLGFAVADNLLNSISLRFQSSLHPADFLGRVGADQFAVLIEGARNETELAMAAQRLLDCLAEPFDVADHTPLYVSVSIGIAWHRGEGGDVELLLKNADTAMHAAKQGGRRQYAFFAAELDARAREFLSLSNALRAAVGAGALTLHYQPRVELATGRVAALEALARWHDAALGFISPARFIPIAEQTGLIEAIGEFVLREGCRQRKAWLDRGLGNFRVAINLSPLQMAQANLIEMVAGILQETGLPASYLELEITESTVIDEPDRVVEKLNGLRAMGIAIALDDFGTGYSSLSYLKRLPLDCMKIDQSFVRHVPDDEQDVAITRAIITLARNLKLQVVMEGVETAEQLAFARVEGCDEYQGYLYSRPLPSDEIEALLSAANTAAV